DCVAAGAAAMVAVDGAAVGVLKRGGAGAVNEDLDWLGQCERLLGRQGHGVGGGGVEGSLELDHGGVLCCVGVLLAGGCEAVFAGAGGLCGVDKAAENHVDLGDLMLLVEFVYDLHHGHEGWWRRWIVVVDDQGGCVRGAERGSGAGGGEYQRDA